MKRLIIGVLALALTAACGDVTPETQSQMLQRDTAPSEYMSFPVLAVDSVDLSEAYAFGYNAADGWHWATQRGVNPAVVTPLPFNASFEFESVFKGIEGGNGAYNFSAATPARSAFQARLRTSSEFSIPSTSIDFSAASRAQISFSPSLGAGSGGSCDLGQLCDVASALCRGADCGFAVSECRQAIYQVQIPSELGPLVCAVIDFAQCAIGASSEQELAYCAGSFVVVVEDENDRPLDQTPF